LSISYSLHVCYQSLMTKLSSLKLTVEHTQVEKQRWEERCRAAQVLTRLPHPFIFITKGVEHEGQDHRDEHESTMIILVFHHISTFELSEVCTLLPLATMKVLSYSSDAPLFFSFVLLVFFFVSYLHVPSSPKS
ncbi:liprin-beta-2-like, partial [Tachysurus ichikawai]